MTNRRSLYTEQEIRKMSDADLIVRYTILLYSGTFTHASIEAEMKRRGIL